ncbi:MAG: hypothetical protein K2P94_15815 [Rhodospirillaceae bacterium]|nr:hypothetical protein [Rhodospirillaceae bacterium]
MKRFAWFLIFLCMSGSGVTVASEATPKSAKLNTPFPYKYPVWLAHILAPLGVAEAQALMGMGYVHEDPCKGANWLQAAAKQHHTFAEMQLLGYYHVTGMRDSNRERFKKAFLWWLHFETHFPDEKDESQAIVDMLKLTPEEENSVRELFKTWKPGGESPVEPASCPGTPFSW